jgi:hypothetical protein
MDFPLAFAECWPLCRRGPIPASFTACLRLLRHTRSVGGYAGGGKGAFMVGISIAMVVALVGWGDSYFGWVDPKGEIQLAIVTTFILGIICGYRVKN